MNQIQTNHRWQNVMVCACGHKVDDTQQAFLLETVVCYENSTDTRKHHILTVNFEIRQYRDKIIFVLST